MNQPYELILGEKFHKQSFPATQLDLRVPESRISTNWTKSNNELYEKPKKSSFNQESR